MKILGNYQAIVVLRTTFTLGNSLQIPLHHVQNTLHLHLDTGAFAPVSCTEITCDKQRILQLKWCCAPLSRCKSLLSIQPLRADYFFT